MKQLSRLFTLSCALCLALTSVAKLYSCAGTASMLDVLDPLFLLPNRELLALVGIAEAAGAVYLIATRSLAGSAIVCLCFSTNFLVYRLWNFFHQIRFCPCLGTVTDHLPLKRAVVDGLLWALLVYMLAGSAFILVWCARRGRSEEVGPRPGACVHT
jgi:hypothetical protein